MRGGIFALIMVAIVLTATAHAEATEAPCPVYEMRGFIVYFEPGSADVSADGQAVIESFAAYFLGSQSSTDRCLGPIRKVDLIGHTDAVGDADQNALLSRHRAVVVGAQLLALGVPPDALTVAGRGEDQPAVKTDDTAHEPLNNRVVIDYRFGQVEP